MKYFLRTFPLLFLSLIVVFSVHAATATTVTGSSIMMPVPPIAPSPTSVFPFGQNHRYSVVFRGNGEAVVTLNAVIPNTSDQPLSEVKFRVPKGTPTDIIAYQVIAPRQCIRYDYVKLQGSAIAQSLNPPCLQYQEPNYNQYFNGNNATYQKADAQLATDTIVVTLPKPIASQGIGSIILYYRSFAYTQKNIVGGYKFSFESLKVEDKIQTLQIGISTDSDLLLKNSQGTVNYQVQDAGMMMKAQSSMMLTQPAASPEFDQFYRQIGQGSITKTSSDLNPLDSYTVTGDYAQTWFQLYAKGIGIAVLLFVIGIVVLVGLVSQLIKKLHHRKGNGKSLFTMNPFVAAMIGSFSTAFLIVLYTVGLVILSWIFPSYLPYDVMNVITLLIFIISFAAYALIVFTPAILVGLKYGITWGIATVGLFIVWMVLFSFSLILFFVLTRMNSFRQIQPYPMMGTSGIIAPKILNQSQ